MKSSVNKGFFTYFLIFLVIVAAIVLSVGAIMIMSPDVKILGYEYINSKTSMTIISYNGNDRASNTDASILLVDENGETLTKLETGASFINFNGLEKLVIKTNTMNVNVMYGEEDKIEIVRDVKGFSKVDVVEKLVITKHFGLNTFTITALDTVPTLAFSNSSKINVHLKQRITNLVVEVESVSADLSVATTAFNSATQTDLTLKSVKYATKTGNLTLSKTASLVGFLKIDSEENTTVAIGKDLVLSQNFEVNMKKGNVKAKTIKTTNAIFGGETVSITGNDLIFWSLGSLTLKVKNGNISFNKVDGSILDVNEVAENLQIKIKEVTGDFTMNKIELDKANKANIEIDDAKGKIFIKTSSGNVKIKSAKKNVDVETISGSINVMIFEGTMLYPANFNLKTDSGNIAINANFIQNTSNIFSNKGNVEFNYLNTLSDFEINITTKNKNSITFMPLNETYESLTVVGYPTPLDAELGEFNTEKVFIETGGKVKVSAVQKF